MRKTYFSTKYRISAQNRIRPRGPLSVCHQSYDPIIPQTKRERAQSRKVILWVVGVLIFLLLLKVFLFRQVYII